MMRPSLWQELRYGAHEAFRVIVPIDEARIPLTLQTGIYPVLCYAPFIFLAYLSRRPDTYLIRLLWLPTVITAVLVAAYRFYWVPPELNVYNWGQRFLAAACIAKSLQYALIEEGMLKVGETRPGVMKDKNNEANGFVPLDHRSRSPYIATWLYDAIELAHTMRGLNWKFSQGMYIPKVTRPLERTAFLYSTFISFVQNFLVLDFLDTLLKLFPGLGTPMGGTIFDPTFSPFTRYTMSTVIHIMTGTAIISGFGTVYDLITLFAVAFLDSSPLSWPPIMDEPWRSESMHTFWAKDWHQTLRQTFIVFGGYPGKWLAGDYGMVFGTFLASGLFHSCSMQPTHQGFDHNTVVFFASQSLVLAFEKLWRQFTGKRVGGWVGRLWVYFVLFVGAQPMVDAWHRRGLGGGMVIPSSLSPMRLIILPLVKRFLLPN